MNYTYIGYFITSFFIIFLFYFQAFSQLLIALLFIGFYIIVIESNKYPKLRKFVNRSF